MDHEAYRRYFDVLELAPGASLTDVRKAYIRLKELYSTDSLAIMAVDDDISGDYKAQVLAQIQEAYHRLRYMLEKKEREVNGQTIVVESQEDHPRVASSAEEVYSGSLLKKIREELQIGLEAVATATRVPLQSLEYIEQENFSGLPAEVFTRGFVVAYARHLALDVESVVADYMQRYREWKSEQDKKPGSGLLARLTGRK